MTTYQKKYIYCNIDTNQLTDVEGYQPDVITLPYQSNILMLWHIRDTSNNGIDLTGATFQFNIASAYNASNLIEVDNSLFISGDWVDYDVTTGQICCRLNMDDADVLTFIDSVASKNAYAALWMTVGGVDYCLASFSVIIKNTIY